MSNLVKHSTHMDSKEQKTAALQKKQNDNPHICVPFSQYKPSVVLSPPYSQSVCAKIGALDPSTNRNRFLEIFDAAGASSNFAQKGLFVHVEFSNVF